MKPSSEPDVQDAKSANGQSSQRSRLAYSASVSVLCACVLGFLVPSVGNAAIPAHDRVRVLEKPRAIPETTLTDQHSRTFSFEQLRSKVVLVFFGFTNCPDVCPMTMGKFRQLQLYDNLDTEKVAFVLISVDGERDTPEVLKQYLENYSPDFIGLTADPKRVKMLAREFSASFYKGQVSESDGSYSMMHSPQSFVLDREGQLRAEFYNPTIDAMAGVIRELLSDGE